MKILRRCICVTTLISALLLGCTPTKPASDEAQPDNTAANEDQQAEEADRAEHSSEHAHNDHAAPRDDIGLAGLTLNSGEKWQMDTHTREMIEALNETVSQASMTSIEAGQRVGTTLDEQLKTLIRGCTMEGAGHDNLHVFLSSFMPAVAELKSAASLETARNRFGEIEQMLQTYERYFE